MNRNISVGGIDPGVYGALAVIRPDNSVEFYDPITVAVELSGKTKAGGKRHRSEYVFGAMADLIRGVSVSKFVIEKVVAMPSRIGRVAMPASLAMQVGVGFGMWQMGAAMVGAACHVVHAATWKAALMRDQAKTKEAAVSLAARLYPGAASRLYGPRGALLDGRAEALLLAHYGLTL